jgi:hypothetical protein
VSFYSFDTSALINGRRDLLPPATFPSVWLHIEAMVEDGFVRCVDEVRRELAKRDGDAVHRWAKGQPRLFVELDADIQAATSTILAEHPKLVGVGKGRSGADPFVIALDELFPGVSGRRRSGSVGRVRWRGRCAR